MMNAACLDQSQQQHSNMSQSNIITLRSDLCIYFGSDLEHTH